MSPLLPSGAIQAYELRQVDYLFRTESDEAWKLSDNL